MDLPALRPIPFCTGMDTPAGRVHVDTGMDARTDNALAYEHPRQREPVLALDQGFM